MQPSEVHETIGSVMLADGAPIVVDLERSHGAWLVDAITGKAYIDFFAFFASQPIGYNHPKMKEPSFLKELTLAALSKPSCSDFYTVQMAEFVRTFRDLAMPTSMHHLFLISGGALAVENALKVAFDWKMRRNLQMIKGAPEKWDYRLEVGEGKIIHFRQAFHGRSGYTLSLTNTADPRKYMHFPKFDWPRIINPRLHFPVTEKVLADVKQAEAQAVDEIEAAVRRYPGQIAALIIEPIQCEGGDNHFRPEFMRELRRLADEHDFLFIVDEVQTGMGATGKMWAIEHAEVLPDIIAFGKKSQVCGIIAGPRIDEVADHVFAESSRINSTFGGNLVDMVRSKRYLEIIAEEHLLDNATAMGARIVEGLETIAEASGGIVSNVRGKGMIIAFDLPTTAMRDAMLERMFENGLYALKAGECSVRFRPMMDITAEIVDWALEIVEASVPQR